MTLIVLACHESADGAPDAGRLEPDLRAVADRADDRVPSLADALFYSLGAMTTLGAAGVALPLPWRMMGVLEAMNGTLLFGISTAYIYAQMKIYWPMLSHER